MRRLFWLVVVIAVFGILGCGNKSDEKKEESTTTTGETTKTTGGETQTDGSTASKPPTDQKVKVTDIKPGKGPAAANDDLVIYTYTGKLKDGTVFDSNTAPDADPKATVLGGGTELAGLEQGLIGMKQGGERKVEVPYMLGYGDVGLPPKVPEKADLTYDLKVLYIVKKGEESGYERHDLKPGSGPPAKQGDTLRVDYTGKLMNGKIFDTSKGKSPLEVKLGAGGVIPAWEVGLIGSKKGMVRRLVVPPAIAYGEAGYGPIGPNQVLDFEIEVVSINGK